MEDQIEDLENEFKKNDDQEDVVEGAKTIELAVQEKPKEVKEKPKEVKEKPKEVQEKPKEVKEKPKEVKEKPKELTKQELVKAAKEVAEADVASGSGATTGNAAEDKADEFVRAVRRGKVRHKLLKICAVSKRSEVAVSSPCTSAV